MIPPPADDRIKEAFALHQAGKYAESQVLCNRLLESTRDPSLEILAAINLFSLGKFEDAEVHFRDLARRMPESSHVHSYLAKVLEIKGDTGAISEYAAAVRLDPANLEALRSYAAGLIARNDHRGALPTLKKLHILSGRPDDLRLLVATLTGTGRYEEACLLCTSQSPGAGLGREYAEALQAAGRYREAADKAWELHNENPDPALLRIYLAAHARASADEGMTAYASAIRETSDPGICLDYTLLLRERKELLRALATSKKLLDLDNCPQYRLLACEISAELGDHPHASGEYEGLIRDILNMPIEPEDLRQILRSYRKYLFARFSPDEARQRFLCLISGDTDVTCLEETARMYREEGKPEEARSWYYRAYRADFLTGGLSYAIFLATSGDMRECEKVLLHILANVKKPVDLSRVAAVVTELDQPPQYMKRLTLQLIKRLEEQRQILTSDDRECLAAAYLHQAAYALSQGDGAACIRSCLCGIDVLPAYPRFCQTGDFLTLINRAKEQALTDTPVMTVSFPQTKERTGQTLQEIVDRVTLSEAEQKILMFLATHRRASETDLRRLLGSRRVTGMVNLMLRKMQAQGLMLIEKKGMGTDGEIYEYCGP